MQCCSRLSRIKVSFELLILFSQNGRFGHAISLIDLNSDGIQDLIVGAPGVGSGNLTYNVSMACYFGILFAI